MLVFVATSAVTHWARDIYTVITEKNKLYCERIEFKSNL